MLGACTIPGIRPEGRILAISGTAPATRDAVYARARAWFARDYVIDEEAPIDRIRGHQLIRPPNLGRIEVNATETIAAANSLNDWLSCASARWPRCP